MAIIFIALIFIFLDALGLIDQVFGFLKGTSSGEFIGSALLLILIVVFIVFVTHERKGGNGASVASGTK